MTNSPLTIEISGRIYLFIPLAVMFIYTAIWYYRRTNPVLPAVIKTGLTILRMAALALTLMLLFKFSLLWVKKAERLPELAVLIDNSASMSANDKSREKSPLISSILSKKNLELLGKLFTLRFFAFSDTVGEISEKGLDTLAFDGASSDIYSAMVNAGNIIDASQGRILLLSDGAFNKGANPERAADKCPAPVFTVGIGDSIPPKDLSIRCIEANPRVYFKDEIPVEAEVLGYPGAVSSLILEDEMGRTLARKEVNFTAGALSNAIEFHFKPDSIGTRVYCLRLIPAENESSLENNLRHFSVEVMENRIRVLLITSSPSADLAFLRRILQRNDNIELSALIEKSAGRFYGSYPPPHASEYDVIILLDFPAGDSDALFTSEVLKAVENGRGAAIVPIASFDSRRLQPVQHLLPCSFGAKGEETAVRLLPESDIPSLTNFFPAGISWAGLAPVNRRRGWVKFRPEADILLRFENNEAALGYTHLAGTKIIVFGAYDLWRLSLQDAEHCAGDSLMACFWQSCVRWLAVRQKEDLFILQTEKTVFSAGENIVFSAWLYDENYHPVSQGRVELEIEAPSGNIPLQLKAGPNGLYQAENRFFQTGSYHYRGSAFVGTDTLNTGGEFVVESFNAEYIDAAMKPEIMRNIAASSGGKFYLPQDFSHFMEENQPGVIIDEVKREFNFFPGLWALIGLLMILALEWSIRKRKGLL